MTGNERRTRLRTAKSNQSFRWIRAVGDEKDLMREILQKAADTPLGGALTGATPFSLRRAIGVVLTTLLGIAFFNALIGVFGLSAAVIALLLFLALAVLIFRRPQTERARQ
jgi:hypothetical protein